MRDALGDGATADLVANWRGHAEEHETVVTFFGAYDTGKSSLIRRLLADKNLSIPDWLTVTARHETYSVKRISWDGLLLQDTPGIGQGRDARVAANTQKALDALLLSDVLVITLPPQLMTAERDVIESVVADWANEAVAFAIGRFDEAGADPESDPDDYRVRAREKAVELRRALQLPAKSPIFVVAADPFGLHSSDGDVNSSTWVATRDWDGMDGFTDWLAAQADCTETLRAHGERRYWFVLLADHLEAVYQQLETTQALLAEATKAKDRRSWHDRQLESLAGAARSSLDGVVEEAVRAAALHWQPGVEIDPTSIENALGSWYDAQRNKLMEYRSSVIAEAAAQRERPIIKVILGKEPEGHEPSLAADRIRKLTPQVQKVLTAIRQAAPAEQARTAGNTARATTVAAAQSARKGFLNRAVGAITIAEGVVGPAGELLALLSEEADRRSAVKDRARQREQLRVEIRQGCRAAADVVYREWEAEMQEVSDEVDRFFAGLAGSEGALTTERDRLQSLHDRGLQLKAARPSDTTAGSD
jgi:hypothetical protein